MKYYIFEALNNKFLIGEHKVDYLTMIHLMNKYSVDGYLLYSNNPLEMKVYNKDGSRATMCGNGIRCFLLYGMIFYKLSSGKHLVKVANKKIECEILRKEPFSVKVKLSPDKKLPIHKKVFFYKGKMISLYTIFIGTLSHVLLYDAEINIKELIKYIKKDLKLKNGNISFVKIKSRNELEVLTHERGVGFTYSCGTGNAACFYVMHNLNLVDDKITIINKGGKMTLEYNNNSVYLYGSASLLKGIELWI